MAEMVALEKFLCRSAPWRWLARRYIVPWALQGLRPEGQALEIGGGAGVMAEQLLDSFPHLELTVTDYDASMLDRGRNDLERFGARTAVQVADATSLSFAEASFDFVFSFIMLHHVLDWEKAIGEAVRVLKPGGYLIGFDLLDTSIYRTFHRLEGAEVRLLRSHEIQSLLEELPVDLGVLTKGGFGSLIRFKIRKRSS